MSVIIIYLSFLLLITGKIVSLIVKRSFSRLHSMLKGGMSKDGRKMLPMHVTLKAGVSVISICSLFVSAFSIKCFADTKGKIVRWVRN